MTPLHNWEPIKHKGMYVVAWRCIQCGASVGRHFADWSEDKPPVVWLEATGIGEECKLSEPMALPEPKIEAINWAFIMVVVALDIVCGWLLYLLH